MASNDQHQDQKRSNDPLQEQNRQLLDTIKKTLELQEKGLIPNLNIDPKILESLSHENPEQYLETLKKTAGEIRAFLSKLTPQNQLNACTKDLENVPSGKSLESSNFNESHLRLGGNTSSVATANSHDSVDEDEDDLYENTGPGSRVARFAVSDGGK